MKNFYLNGIFKIYQEERNKLKKAGTIFFTIILSWIILDILFYFIQRKFLIPYINVFFIKNITKIPKLKIQDLNLLISLFNTILPILTFVFMSRYISKHSYKSLGFTKNKLFKNYFVGSLIGFLMFSVSVFIGFALGLQRIFLNEFSFKMFLFFLIGFLIQGMSEEIMLRAVIFPEISSKFGIVKGIVFNSIIFSAMHLLNDGITYLAVINLFLFGVFMSLMYYYYQNIWIIGAIHSIWNFTQGNVFGVPVSGIVITEQTIFKSEFIKSSIITGENFGTEGGLICTFILIVSIFILMFINKNTFNIDKDKN